MKNTSKFQNVVIATIVGWLVLFVFLPNLMIIATSFLTRDDANFVKLVFTLDNYSRLLDPLYYDVLLHPSPVDGNNHAFWNEIDPV